MDIASIVTTILGCAGGILAGILAYIKFFAERKDTKQQRSFEAILDEHLAPIVENQKKIMAHNEMQDQQIREVRLDTTRTQLLVLMHHEPSNHDTIFKIAHRYFVELGGDWYMSSEFQKWADREKISIPAAIMQAIAANDHKK